MSEETKFMKLKFDVMDELDGIFFGTFVIDTNKDIVVDRYGSRPVVSKSRLIEYVKERRPTLRNRSLAIFPINDSFVLDRLS